MIFILRMAVYTLLAILVVGAILLEKSNRSTGP